MSISVWHSNHLFGICIGLVLAILDCYFPVTYIGICEKYASLMDNIMLGQIPCVCEFSRGEGGGDILCHADRKKA